MSVSRHVIQYTRARLVRRMMRSIPWLGAAVALVTLGATVRRKGLAGGALDTALDVMPVVGAVKNTLEVVRGRDFIRDKASRTAMPVRRA